MGHGSHHRRLWMWGCPCSGFLFPFYRLQFQNVAQATPHPGKDLLARTVASAPPPQTITPNHYPNPSLPNPHHPNMAPQICHFISITPTRDPNPSSTTQADHPNPSSQPITPIP